MHLSIELRSAQFEHHLSMFIVHSENVLLGALVSETFSWALDPTSCKWSLSAQCYANLLLGWLSGTPVGLYKKELWRENLTITVLVLS